MGISTTEFESFEQQLLELVGEIQLITSSEARLREALRAEATRAEAAEAARDASERAAAEARAAAAAANAGATHAINTLAKAQDELAATKMQFELTERHRVVLEEKCSEMSLQVESLKRELQKMQPLQAAQTNMQRQYNELQEKIQNVTVDARRETSRLESELRRVEKTAQGGAELRERARLAAAAHARERRLAAAELQHATRDLNAAKAETTKLLAQVAELKYRLSELTKEQKTNDTNIDPLPDALVELRASLEAERNGTARLETALAAALADNATLSAALHASDNAAIEEIVAPKPVAADPAICPIDSFLAD